MERKKRGQEGKNIGEEEKACSTQTSKSVPISPIPPSITGLHEGERRKSP